jgi:hypothetical protein
MTPVDHGSPMHSNHEQKPLPAIAGIRGFDRPIMRVANTQ